MTAGAQAGIAIERALSVSDDVRALVGSELVQHYPPEQRHGLALDAIFQSHVRFFIACVDGVAAGCGGIALFPGFAEIKRMYVSEAWRGRGVADAIITRLAQEAAAGGLAQLRLETGTAQTAAIRFYGRHGFRTCAAFEPYSLMPPQAIATSVFMERRSPEAKM